ncbi:MAG: hypothetical protein EOO71_26110 [Myxococcaceae bacterium]|nr:MAG: hypothetical protein EOO71_26110 [Myxococcaceae bacterium]
MQPRLVEGPLPGLAGAFGGTLPCVAGPFSKEEAQEFWARLEGIGGHLGVFGGGLFLQPSLEGMEPLSLEEAKRIAIDAELRDSNGRPPSGYPWIGAFEFPRCWAFLLWEGPGMPPGGAVIVDKHSRTAMPMRYIDVEQDLRVRGFDTTPPGSAPEPSPASREPPTRQELVGDVEQWKRQPDAHYTEADGTRLHVEVWRCDITGLDRELDPVRKRHRLTGIRGSPPSDWEPYRDG